MVGPRQTVTNSSPARRATASPERSAARMRPATALEHQVPDRVTERVVDGLEAVEVDELQHVNVAVSGQLVQRVVALDQLNELSRSAGVMIGWLITSPPRA
jgi:hypothetical protein